MDGRREYHSKGGRKAGTGGVTMLGESPCDKCLRGTTYCSDNGLACEDYLHYIKKGKVRLRDRAPSRDCYMRIQASDIKKESSQKEKNRAEEKNGTKEKSSTQEESASEEEARSLQKEISQKIKAATETTANLRRLRETPMQGRYREAHYV